MTYKCVWWDVKPRSINSEAVTLLILLKCADRNDAITNAEGALYIVWVISE